MAFHRIHFLANETPSSKSLNHFEVVEVSGLLDQPLDDEFNKKTLVLDSAYTDLVDRIDPEDSLGSMIDKSFLSILERYRSTIAYIDIMIVTARSLDDFVMQEDPYGLKFWLGENPQANQGEGDGFGEKLRYTVQYFRKDIATRNEMLAFYFGKDSWYIPEPLQRDEKVSWVVQHLSGTWDVDIAQLQGIRLDQAKVMEKEIEFLRSLVDDDGRK
jgi:hypothetical protein